MEARRSAMNTNVNKVSKTTVLKTQSDVSLTPSQAAEQAKLNARKNPLDALSRSSIRQGGFERRSGLQDVDEEYLKLNVFARPQLSRHSGLGDPQAVLSGQQQADAQSISNVSMKGQPQGNTQGGQQMQQQGQAQVAAAGQTQSQPQQGQGQGHGQGQGNQSNAAHNMQAPNQSANMGQGQGQIPAQSQPQVSPQNPASAVEPDMCTTCPNCQTTIYLVRDNASEPIPAGNANFEKANVQN